jgi:glycosyltransferase involved in cell wall biosynthesis
VAVEATRLLNRRGLQARLTVLGPHGTAHPEPFLRLLPFLPKGTPEADAALGEYISRAHLFVLPTRADCAPVSIAEANAYAVPAVASAVGGIPSMIEPGRNGELLEPGASPEAVADCIAAMVGDRASYERLALGAYSVFRERLNWGVAIDRFGELASGLRS